MRDHPWRSHAARAPSASSRPDTALRALQRVVGHRGTAQVLARQGGSNQASFENSVRVGSLGTFEVKDSNVGDWISHKADAADLIVTTVAGKHSEALKKLADGKTRVDIEVQTISGENAWIIVTFTNARIRGYAADASGKTEQWKAVDFDHVDIKRTSIGKPR